MDRTAKPARQTGKKAARTETVDDDQARSGLPFNVEEDDASTIIEALVGRTITWRRTIDAKLDSAKVPQRARNCRVAEHPKSGRLMISFYESQGSGDRGELLGGERTVFIDKIIRVK